jgi:hypothetical protein
MKMTGTNDGGIGLDGVGNGLGWSETEDGRGRHRYHPMGRWLVLEALRSSEGFVLFAAKPKVLFTRASISPGNS